MSSSVQDSVILITSSQSNILDFGTGFVIHRDDQAIYVLTCAHVIENVGGRESVVVGGCPAAIITLGSYDGADDIAVLRIENFLHLSPLKLGIVGEKGRSFIAPGFSQQKSNLPFEIKRIQGILGEPIGLESRKKGTRINAWEIETDSANLQPGYSGAPVIDEKSEVVLGMVIQKIGEGKKGRVISIEALQAVWKDMPPDLLTSERNDPKSKRGKSSAEEATGFQMRPLGSKNGGRIFNLRQTVYTKSARACVIEQFLGSGSEGEVYRVKFEEERLGMKWYFPYYLQQFPDLPQRLEHLIKHRSPDNRFLWPIELTSTQKAAGFGILVPLREDRFKGLVDLMTGRVDPPFRTVATMGFELAHSFSYLHSNKLCYQDISLNNVFFDPNTGEIRITDFNLVGIDGQSSSISGTPRFMAPEVVRGEAFPGKDTDLFSLAVLLFHMLMIHHPLFGKKELEFPSLDLAALHYLCGKNPSFIFDPDNDSNRPVPGQQDNALVFWPIYPKFLRNLFIKSFTDGIRNPHYGRVSTTEWQTAMIRLRDCIIHCSHCGVENFYDPEAFNVSNRKGMVCWACQNESKLPPRIHIGNDLVMLNYDTQLFPHHIDNQSTYDFSSPVAEITQFLTVPTTIQGLKNISNEKWVVITKDGITHEALPGQIVTIEDGLRISFGKVEGEIET